MKKNGVIDELPEREVFKKSPVNRIFLTVDEIYKLYKYQHPNPKYNTIKDIWVFGCWVGLRFSDIETLKKEHFTKKGSSWFLLKRTEKTSEWANVDLNNEAVKIAKKLDFRFNIATNQYFNRVIKEVAKDSGLFNDIANGEARYKQIFFHTCRISYITNLVNANMPINEVLARTGHKKLETLMLYIKLKPPENNYWSNKVFLNIDEDEKKV